MRTKYTEQQKIKMVDMYTKGFSSVQIAKEFNGNASTVAGIIKRKIGNLRSNKINNRKYNYDKNYFNNIDTEHKAYWLGFIYADGYISNTNNQKKFGVALSIKDKKHLEKLNDCLNSNYPIHEYNCTGYSQGNKYCRLQIFGDNIADQLFLHGVYYNKTKILQAPNISKKLIPHFIRGYMDGDGCITYNASHGRIEYAVKIVGTKNILNFIKDYIEDNKIAKINKFFKRHEHDEVFNIDLQGNYQVKNFLDLIYKNATMYLNRKFDRYLKLCNFIDSRAYQER